MQRCWGVEWTNALLNVLYFDTLVLCCHSSPTLANRLHLGACDVFSCCSAQIGVVWFLVWLERRLDLSQLILGNRNLSHIETSPPTEHLHTGTLPWMRSPYRISRVFPLAGIICLFHQSADPQINQWILGNVYFLINIFP